MFPSDANDDVGERPQGWWGVAMDRGGSLKFVDCGFLNLNFREQTWWYTTCSYLDILHTAYIYAPFLNRI